jgi:hypothetical protein
MAVFKSTASANLLVRKKKKTAKKHSKKDIDDKEAIRRKSIKRLLGKKNK